MRYRQRFAAIIIVATLAGCAGRTAFDGGALPTAVSAPGVHDALSLVRSVEQMREHAKSGLTSVNANGGAGYPVTADPPVPVPNETPCVDKLFGPKTPPLTSGNLPVGDFADYSNHPFKYSPPANCPGPYARIVFKMHFRVTAGVQYDRTGAIWIGGTNVFFGTTSEPGATASPEWTIQRDVSEYASIFAQAGEGQAAVYNIVNNTYTGVIYGRAELDFYPATKQFPAAQSADAVYPMANSSIGGYVYLDGPSDQMTGSFTFPQNVERAYLDVFLQSQSSDEFWYTCFPNGLAKKLDNCGNSAFREGEVAVDGQPAGVVPIYPWIFTGGIDPYLWIPITGVETLNFKPYRIDLTPFAGQLDDGNPHTVSVSVFNDDDYFAATAAVVVYEDHGSAQVKGALLSDGTAAQPSVKILNHVHFHGKTSASGTIAVTATHPVSLEGYVITSKGRITTTVSQNVSFSNVQQINIASTRDIQDIKQETNISSITHTQAGSKTTKVQSQWLYPLNLNYRYIVGSSNAKQTVSISQTKSGSGLNQGPGKASAWMLLNTVHSSDLLTIAGGGFTPSNGKSSQQYKSLAVEGRCYEKTLESKNYGITSSRKGC
jgi:hypothetical protein